MADEKFKVFISWSGELARRVATVWKDLIKESFDTVEPFMSEENIGAGERGLAKIASELSGTSFGIVVVTQANQNSQWLNYEAGALSKDVNDQTVRVAPCLVDFERKNDVTGPLGQFQGTLLNKEGVERVLVAISHVIGVDEAAIRTRFGRAWAGEYERRFDEAREDASGPSTTTRRKPDEILDEILTHVRELARAADNPALLFRRTAPVNTLRRVPELKDVRDTVATHTGLNDVDISVRPEGGLFGLKIGLDESTHSAELLEALSTDLLNLDNVGSVRFSTHPHFDRYQ